MRKELPQQLLRELLKNSKRSDRELAKVLGVSQPTITRTRHKLEEEGIIRDYTVIPDFRKMGFELLTFTFVTMHPDVRKDEIAKEARKQALQFPNVIFASPGEGLGMTGVIMSFHQDFTDYKKTMNLLRVEWKEHFVKIESFLVALGEEEYKGFSLTYLKDTPL